MSASSAHYFVSERWVGSVTKRLRFTWAGQEVGTTRAEVVRQILADELSPYQILEVIPDEQIINDVTKDIAQDVKEAVLDRGEGFPDFLVDFVERHTPGFVRRAA